MSSSTVHFMAAIADNDKQGQIESGMISEAILAHGENSKAEINCIDIFSD